MSFVVPSVTTSSPGPGPVECTMTVAEFIAVTQDHLYGSTAQMITTLTTQVTATGTTLVLGSDAGIGPRRTLSIDDELIYVVSWVAATLTATVVRGFRGTTKAVHSAGSEVEVNARFPRYMIRRALREEISGWPDGLFAIDTVDIETATSVRGYDLAIGDYIRVLDAFVSPAIPTSTDVWTRIDFTDRRSQDTADFASGTSITFNIDFTPSRTVRVIYAKRFVTTDMSDDIACSTIGLWPSMTDIPSLGAAWRLIQGKEVRRLDLNAQGQNRSAEQVQAGVASATSRAFGSMRDARIQQEQIRMLARYPTRFR